MTGSLDSDLAHAAALAGLPGMTPVRLARSLDGFTPVSAWSAIRAGIHPADEKRRFAPAARTMDVESVGHGYVEAGIAVLVPGRPAYPTALIGDPGAPAVLFARGNPGVLDRTPRVAVVGTRSATHYGRQVAAELGADLAGEGITVVSGLALGIDAAVHTGVVRGGSTGTAPPVAVVGTGLDEVYPSANKDLWESVAGTGVILSESPLGTKPRPGVFPARNRIIAALSDVVVIVESHLRGGSLYTAEAAARRSIPVCAVPGSVRSPSSAGTNALLVDGCIPVRDATDVIVALGLVCAGRGEAPPAVPPRSRQTSGIRHEPTVAGREMKASQRAVWQAVEDTPTVFETVLLRSGLSTTEAALACEQLVVAGALVEGSGWWTKA